jgi:ABC-type Fe3+ transport system permease subunit
MTVVNVKAQGVSQSEWGKLGWYAIPAVPLFFLYLMMGALPFHLGADLGWWPADYNTDAGEAASAFRLGGIAALAVLAVAIPIVASSTRRGMRLRVTSVGALLLAVGLPLVAWAIGLALWFL